MSITKEQQQALDDAIVPREQRLRIGNSFLISGSVPAIYMHEFWATVSYHKHNIKFKMNKNNYSFNLETFRDMLQICLNLPGQKFKDPPFEEEILAFIRELGYPRDIKSLSDVKVDTLYQPWRTFGTIINKCLSGKATGLDQLRLSRAQIIWGMYNQKKVDYVYLLWEDLVYQIENKVSKKNKDIRNKVDWHMANDDPILTTMRFIPKHEAVQKYGAILPNTLTNQAMKESDTYKTYHDFATRNVIPKPKYVRRSTREKTDQAPTASPGKRLNAIAKISWKSSDKDDDDEVSISKDDDDNADNEDDDGQDDDYEQTELDNDGDDFIHSKFSTHDKEERQDEEDKEKEGSDLRVQTPSHFESTNDEVSQGDNVEGEELDEEETNKEEEANELYRDVNINLERRDTEMTDALQTNVQGTQVIEDTHVIITAVTLEVQQKSSSVSSGFISNMLNPNPDTGIDSILNLNTESTSLVDVPVTTNVEMPPSSFEDRVKALEDDFLEFKQTNIFSEAISSIPSIVDKYLANKMNKAVKAAIQLQSDRLREEAHAENEDFINKIDENIKKIIKEQVKAQTSHAVAANLSELELKKILIDKMESNQSIHRSVQQKTLYKALVDAYETDKVILDTYGDTVTFKICRDDQDEDEEPSAKSNRGSKRRRDGKEPESTSAPKEKTSKSTGKSKEGSKSHQKSTGFTEDQHVDETTQHPDWFQKTSKPPTPNRDWNTTLPAKHGPVQPWISTLAQNEDTRESFNVLIDTPLDFLAFMLNRLKVDTLTPELLAGPTFELMKGLCKSLVELKYFLEEVCKATTDQLDWDNPEGQQYPHDLRKPLPLIPNSRGCRVIPFDHFINNDLAYLSGGVSSRTYATLVTKTKATDYGHIKWIEDFIPNSMWSHVPIIYDKHALWGISHWGRKRQQFYGFEVNRESARDVYSKHRILAITKLKIVEWHNYKHFDWITIRRNDDKLYTFKEGDYNRLHLQDIKDMLLLLVQGKLTNLNIEERIALGVSL
ncbi:hypothetical protein Tco_1083167 [Tanacetum coccineum]|uniref:Uncharacterized protein n=1 Tax=Tanacetum coccineum TaxID=301880 RepID=A0ABQ5I2G5_9ASTR